jgi:hypothetical protein
LLSSSRRSFLATAAATSPGSLLPAKLMAGATTETVNTMNRGSRHDNAIRSCRINVLKAAIVDLRRRIAATRWPDKETAANESQGAQLARLQQLARYWGKGYDWRKVEAKVNALPQFTTNIDGLNIHFIHVKSRQKDALPVIITHGWPGSVFEFINVIGPLMDPMAHGGGTDDAFDVVIPSIPGYGFSSKPTGAGWDPDHIARVWAELMERLGYTRCVAQGGAWGHSTKARLDRITSAPPSSFQSLTADASI